MPPDLDRGTLCPSCRSQGCPSSPPTLLLPGPSLTPSQHSGILRREGIRSTRKGKQRPESLKSRGRGQLRWEASSSMMGQARLPGHLYADPGPPRPAQARPSSPQGFRAATCSLELPDWLLGDKPGSDWLPRSSLTSVSLLLLQPQHTAS